MRDVLRPTESLGRLSAEAVEVGSSSVGGVRRGQEGRAGIINASSNGVFHMKRARGGRALSLDVQPVSIWRQPRDGERAR